MRITVLLTCFNRKEKTVACIKSLAEGNKDYDFEFIVVDDGSKDGTIDAVEALENKIPNAEIVTEKGDGSLFYSGGMRRAMDIAKERPESDYYVLANDDVVFDANILGRIIGSGINSTKDRKEQDIGIDKRDNCRKSNTVIVGAMRDSKGNCSYGGIRYVKGIHYTTVKPSDSDRSCDTFNANFVVIPKEVFLTVPTMDENYRHSFGDFDYGLSIKRAGFCIEVSDFFVGVCNNNPSSGTWRDRSLTRAERIKKKESIKGAPAKQWFYFLKKNFGIGYAIVYSVTPYLRIILGK